MGTRTAEAQREYRRRVRNGQGGRRLGEKHPRAKLCDPKVRVIRHLYGDWGVTIWRLADIFSVDRRTIRRVVSREQWTHI